MIYDLTIKYKSNIKKEFYESNDARNVAAGYIPHADILIINVMMDYIVEFSRLYRGETLEQLTTSDVFNPDFAEHSRWYGSYVGDISGVMAEALTITGILLNNDTVYANFIDESGVELHAQVPTEYLLAVGDYYDG